MIKIRLNPLSKLLNASGGAKENPSIDMIKPSSETKMGMVNAENKYIRFPVLLAAIINSLSFMTEVNSTAEALTISVNIPASNCGFIFTISKLNTYNKLTINRDNKRLAR